MKIAHDIPARPIVIVDDAKEFPNIIPCMIICRDSDAAKTVIENIMPYELWLDFDPGDKSKENGLDILKWALENGRCPDRVVLKTMNPVGKERMADFLVENNYRIYYVNEIAYDEMWIRENRT